MGFKTSLIIIQNPDNIQDNELILKLLGMSERKYESDTVLDECMYPRDESISIGYYNNCIIVCDDFQLTGKFIMGGTSPEEQALVKAFPKSEVVVVACHSVTNFHGYAIIKNSKKIRAKALSADDGFYINTGELIEEEQAIYTQSKMVKGKHIWVYDSMPGNEFAEDQLMEDFTFGIAKRLLGVRIDNMEAEELLDEVPFKKYAKA